MPLKGREKSSLGMATGYRVRALDDKFSSGFGRLEKTHEPSVALADLLGKPFAHEFTHGVFVELTRRSGAATEGMKQGLGPHGENSAHGPKATPARAPVASFRYALPMNFAAFNNQGRRDITAIQNQLATHAQGTYDEGLRGNALRTALSPAVNDYLTAMTRLYAHETGKVPSAKERAEVKRWVFSELLKNLSQTKGYSHKAAKSATFDAFNRSQRADILRVQTSLAHHAQGVYGEGKRGDALRKALGPAVDEYLKVMASKYSAETGRAPSAKERAKVKAYVFAELMKNLRTHYGYEAKAHGKGKGKVTRGNHHGGYHPPGDPLGYERDNGYARVPSLRGQRGFLIQGAAVDVNAHEVLPLPRVSAGQAPKGRPSKAPKVRRKAKKGRRAKK